MIMNRRYWQIQMAVALLGWAFIVRGFVRPYAGGFTRRAWLIVTALWSLHPLEILLFSYKIGRAKGLGPVEIVLKTLAFGITWWKPLKAGILAR